MIEVTLMLHDSQELSLVHNLLMKLEDRRREYGRKRWLSETSPAPEVSDESQGVDPATASDTFTGAPVLGQQQMQAAMDAIKAENANVPANAEEAATETPRVIQAHPALGAPYTAPVNAPEPTFAQLEEALRAFWTVKGFPAARALLDEYGALKLGDVPAEKRAELLVRLS